MSSEVFLALAFAAGSSEAASVYYARQCEKASVSLPASRNGLGFCDRALERDKLTRKRVRCHAFVYALQRR